MSSLPPGPPPIGMNPLSLLLYARQVGSDVLGFQEGRFSRYGDTYRSHLRGLETIVTRDPALIHQALVTSGDAYQKPTRGIGVSQLRHLLGDGLLLSNGEHWRKQRRQIQPAFDASHLRDYSRTMAAYTREHIAAWSQGATVDISQEMMGLTLRIVGKVLMGVDVSDTQRDVAHAMVAFRASLSGLSVVLPRWLPHPAKRRERLALEAMRQLMEGFIQGHLSKSAEDDQCLLAILAAGLVHDSESFAGRKENSLTRVRATSPFSAAATAFWRRCRLASGPQRLVDQTQGHPDAMTKELLRDEALTLFFAGHETTSHALSWTLYLVAKHPQVQAKVLSEVDRVLKGRAASYDDVAELTYTQQVLSEAMRLYPPVPTLLRETRKATQLGPYDLPAGAHVLSSVYHVQRNRAYFAQPHVFDPERFSAERVGEIPPGAYVPFGAGTRVCIGKRFALMEATLILATLYQRYTLTPARAEPPALDVAVTLAPRGGLPMRVAARPPLSPAP